MTTLVAIQGDGWSVLGCDSRSSDEVVVLWTWPPTRL